MTETQKSWLACAIDGEGHISWFDAGITKTGKKKYVLVNVGISNTDKRFCDFAKEITGVGYVVITSSKSESHFGTKPVYYWSIHDHETVRKLLEEIRLYLIIKREKADAVIKKISEYHWRFRTIETRKKFSIIVKNSWKDPIIRQKRIAGMIGKKHGIKEI